MNDRRDEEVLKYYDVRPSTRVSYEEFRDVVVNYLREFQERVFREVAEPLWSDGRFYGLVRRPYYYVDREGGFFYGSLPSGVEEPLNALRYFEFLVKFEEELSPGGFRRAVEEARRRRSFDAELKKHVALGIVDSQQVHVVAPRAVRDRDGKLPRGFCYEREVKCGRVLRKIAYADVRREPERAVIQILRAIGEHLFYRRYMGLCDKLDIPPELRERALRSFRKGKFWGVLDFLKERYGLAVTRTLYNHIAVIALCLEEVERVKRVFGKAQLIRESLERLRAEAERLRQVGVEEVLEGLNKCIMLLERKARERLRAGGVSRVGRSLRKLTPKLRPKPAPKVGRRSYDRREGRSFIEKHHIKEQITLPTGVVVNRDSITDRREALERREKLLLNMRWKDG